MHFLSDSLVKHFALIQEKANEKLRQELATAEETWRGHIDELEKERKELDDVMVQLKQDLADKEVW